MIEDAWDAGINLEGRIETGGIRGTRKYIGTPEVRYRYKPRKLSKTNNSSGSSIIYQSGSLVRVNYHISCDKEVLIHHWQMYRSRIFRYSEVGSMDTAPSSRRAVLQDQFRRCIQDQGASNTNTPDIFAATR